MPKITYIDASGKERTVEGKNGMTVMETAIKHNVPGIDADCGGACACATCHVYVDAAFTDKVGKPSAMEQSMLDFAENVKENSRLSCQIKVRDDLDGLKVTTPEGRQLLVTGKRPGPQAEVVLRNWRLPGRAFRAGTIGGRGPTRMNSPQAMAAVAGVISRMSDRLTEG